ncbi:MAG: DNA gyrase C-terminal beta-propeller domain-containing protein, partial [Anaerolineales bacterium]
QEPDDLIIISANGVALRTKVAAIRQQGRATRGVRLMRLQPGDIVASLACIADIDLRGIGADQVP